MKIPLSRGQAMTEYLVVLAFCLLLLVVAAVDGSPGADLLAALKRYYAAYSFAISLSA